MNNTIIDMVIVISAILFNLVVVGIMLSRIPGWKEIEHFLGLFPIGLILPLGIALFYNLREQREWWFWGIPGLVILYLLLEAILDYIMYFNFRKSRWLGPYLLVFYLAQWGLVGYAFLAKVGWGIVVLVMYFLSLAATAYSYAKVKHG